MYGGSYCQKFVSVNIQMLRGKETVGTFFCTFKGRCCRKARHLDRQW